MGPIEARWSKTQTWSNPASSAMRQTSRSAWIVVSWPEFFRPRRRGEATSNSIGAPRPGYGLLQQRRPLVTLASTLSTRPYANFRRTGSVKPVAGVKVETERKPGSQVILLVEVDADQVSRSIDQAYSRLAPRVRIAGFRPGKAPRPMVEREIRWGTLRQEALDLILPTAYNSALDEAGLDPIDVPRVEVQQFDRGQPMKFTATVSIKPEITLKDYKDIRVPRPQTEIGDNDVDEAIERLRNRYAELHAVERPVQAGDFLTVDTHIVKSGAGLIGASQTDAT